jgi:hypothetical protein
VKGQSILKSDDNSVFTLILGGSAVHRCDKRLVSVLALAAGGDCGEHKESFGKL